MEIDTTNKFTVGGRGDKIVILRAPAAMSRADALNLAAWLVALSDFDNNFPTVLAAVRAS